MKPFSSKIIPSFSFDIEEAHKVAAELGSPTYIDPKTGYQVFTENSLLAKKICCGNGCRHCPYGYFNVKEQPGIKVNRR